MERLNNTNANTTNPMQMKRISKNIRLSIEEEYRSAVLECTYVILCDIYKGLIAVDKYNKRVGEIPSAQLKEVAKWVVTGLKKGLYLWGVCGNGKTTTLNTIRIFLNAIHQSYAVGFQPNNMGLRRRWTSGEKLSELGEDEHYTQSVYEADVLYIDDLGLDPSVSKRWGEEKHPFAELVQKKYNKNSVVIITSNIKPTDLQRRYGERVVDRMKQMFASVEYTERSYRVS